MIWGTFTDTHIATLAFAFFFIILIHLVLVNKSRKTQILSLFLISFIAIAGVAYQVLSSEDPMKNLPLDLSSLAALLLPFAVLTRQKWCCNLLLLWPLQSFINLVFNQDKAHLDVFSFEFTVYFLTNLLTFAIPIILFWLKLVRRDYKYMKKSIVITAVVYTAVHFYNIASGSNYLYSVSPDGNELLSFFYTFVPSYWYMYLMIPIFILYLGQWYLPELLDHRRKTKRLRMKLKEIDDYYEEYEDEYIDEIIEEKYG